MFYALHTVVSIVHGLENVNNNALKMLIIAYETTTLKLFIQMVYKTLSC